MSVSVILNLLWLLNSWFFSSQSQILNCFTAFNQSWHEWIYLYLAWSPRSSCSKLACYKYECLNIIKVSFIYNSYFHVLKNKPSIKNRMSFSETVSWMLYLQIMYPNISYMYVILHWKHNNSVKEMYKYDRLLHHFTTLSWTSSLQFRISCTYLTCT
jgi:hypothetical protein